MWVSQEPTANSQRPTALLEFHAMSLEIPSVEFRRLAKQVADECAELLESLPDGPAYPHTSGAQTERLFAGPPPMQGLGARAFEDLSVVAQHSRLPSPRFFGYVFGSGEPVAALADFYASVLNQNVTAWRSAPAAVTVERTVVRWLAEAVGCGGFSGSLCGGGSSANLMALAMAREARLPANEHGARPGTVYTSSEIHMSIGKAVALLGLGRENLRVVSTGAELCMDAHALERAIDTDVAAGKTPVAVVASAGTVSTGSIDPLREIARVAHGRGLWMHVDGAYGALAAIAAPEKFDGLAEADSLSLDPHKWLYQPADCGCLLYKDPGCARTAFSHTGEYTRVLNQEPLESFAFFEESLELSRRFRALKLWVSLRYHGLEAFRKAISNDLHHAQQLAELVRASNKLELLAPVPLSAVCFRHRGGDDAFNATVLQRVIQRGRVFLSNAVIRGKFALRACFVNHRTSDADVEDIVSEVLAADEL